MPCEILYEPVRYSDFAANDRANRFDQFVESAFFCDETGAAGLERSGECCAAGQAGEHHNFHFGAIGFDESGGVCARSVGKAKVHDDYVGTKLERRFDGRGNRCRPADDGKLWLDSQCST